MESFNYLYKNGLLTERFVNIIGDDKLKNEYVDQVWDLLQKSYENIGGIKGGGFRSKTDMIDNIPMWKLIVYNKTVHGVVLYKDTNGRKSVAMGSDGSDYARKHIISLVTNDIKRAYGEKSKSALGLILKTIPWDILKPYIKTPQEASRILGKDISPIKGLKIILPEDAKTSLSKYPELINYGYLRNIGGEHVFKVMIGTPNLSIK